MQAEVESLIAAAENGSELLEQPAFSLGMKVMSPDLPEASLAGKVIGTYKILELLGKGGMGEVYLAEDSRLDRKVALKFLSNKLVDDGWAKRQLVKEAQAVAKLDHPNICAVYGYEEDNGYSFIVMQYVEGETLAALIRKGPLEPQLITGLAVKIVSAIAEAHAHGIIHRDIKPQNIIVSRSGQVKVLDFGLAKLVQQRQTLGGPGDSESSQVGLVIGTVAYMSPEQLRAERLDFRSDIFSFGIVLYEMISGKNPYEQASSAETISAILTKEPPPLTNLRAPVPVGIARIAQKSLRRDRDQRYQSASALLLDLDTQKPSSGTQRFWQFPSALSAPLELVLFVIVAAAAFLLWQSYPRNRIQNLAVLPIENEPDDATIEYLSEGLTDGLIDRLYLLPNLRVKARTITSGFRGRETDLQTLRKELGVDAAVVGKLRRKGTLLFLHADLLDTRDGSLLWAADFSVDPADTLGLQQELARGVAGGLRLPFGGDAARTLAAHDTKSGNAHDLYFQGRHYWNKRGEQNLNKAISYFREATDVDPLYAKAWAGIADCYVLLSTVANGSYPTKEVMLKARDAARKALEIDETLSEAHTSLGTVLIKYEWRWDEAEKELKRAIVLRPENAQAHFWYSNLLSLRGSSTEAIAEAEAAQELDPLVSRQIVNIGTAYYFARQPAKAIIYARRVLMDNPDDQAALYLLGLSDEQSGLGSESIDVLRKLYSLNPQYGAAALGYVLAKVGKTAEARLILGGLNEMSKNSQIPAQESAIIYIGLGEKDRAFLLLGEACKDRFASLPFARVDPVFDDIRADPRFVDILRCVKLTS